MTNVLLYLLRDALAQLVLLCEGLTAAICPCSNPVGPGSLNEAK